MDAKRQAIRNVMAGSKFQNRRVFLDLRGNTLLLDFRGSTGKSRVGIDGVARAFKFFKKEVDETEGGPLGHGTDGGEGVESYKEGLGFLVTRRYDFNSIRDDEYLAEYIDPDEPYTDRDILFAIDKWLKDDGWKVTWK